MPALRTVVVFQSVMTAVGPQEQELPKGQYKILPNHVRTRKGTDHSYAPVDVTPAELARLTAELRSDAFRASHPVLQAAYAHYALVVIHPFADGNGRVARALASAFTYRAISMPIVILSEQRDTYLNALESADAGNYQSFVDFMLARSLDTIVLVNESLSCATTPSAEESVKAIEALYLTKGGYTHEQIDEAGIKLLQALFDSVRQTFAKIQMQRIGFGGGVASSSGYNEPAGYRIPFTGGRVANFVVSSQVPAHASVSRQYGLLVPKDAGNRDDFQLVSLSTGEPFVARVDELIPALSGILNIRLTMLAERITNEMLAELKRVAERSPHR